MPALANGRHERFCLEYVRCGDNGKKAYAAIYGPSTGAEQSASRLLRRPEVRSRLEEIRNEAAERAEITIDMLVQDFQNIHDKAMLDPKTYMAATNAKIAQAKVCGLWNEKITVAAERMSDTELAEAIKGEQAGSIIPWAEVLKASRGKT